MADPKKEIAFYYPGHLWINSDWVKTLLLFFDGVGLLVPEYKRGEPERFDPTLAGPLRDQGLLHYLIADKVVDKIATDALVAAVDQLITEGAFAELDKDKDTVFHAISRSRMGYSGDEKLADALFQRLKARGLAKDSEDGASIPLHPAVRYTILVLLAQILRPHGNELGLDLSPATDRSDLVRGLTELLTLPSHPSSGRVVEFDLQTVGVDLALVPLDEVLSFRRENFKDHRRYVSSIREFTRELSLMSEAERSTTFDERQSELDDLAQKLRQTARKAWKRPATFVLGMAGASWKFAHGDAVGALFQLAGALLNVGQSPRPEAGAYSYLFSAQRRFR